MQFAILAALGIGAYLIFSSKSTSSAASPAATAAAATAAAQQAATLQAFNDQANALGLTQEQAQNAYALGISPQEMASFARASSDAARAHLGAAGLGAYFLLSSKGGAAVASAQQQSLVAASNQFGGVNPGAANFGQVNPYPNLQPSATDAANAAAIGLTPQEYSDSQMYSSGSWFDPLSKRWYT